MSSQWKNLLTGVSLLVCVGSLLGCHPPDPGDLVGEWWWGEKGYQVRLVFEANHRFLREATVQGEKVVTRGRYRVESHFLVFDEIVEGWAGEPGTPVKGTIKVPFKWREGFLVLNPHTPREQRFQRVSRGD